LAKNSWRGCLQDLGPYNRYEGEVCTEEREGISIVKRREKRGMRIHTRATEEIIYPTFKVISNSTSVLCRKEK